MRSSPPAVSIAERVAFERGEKVGTSVGYHIRLEKKTTMKTPLTFCTNGILLRMLTNSSSSLGSALTHVIVDEIHERDKYADFLMIMLKDLLKSNDKLRLILMSATVNEEEFSRSEGEGRVE